MSGGLRTPILSVLALRSWLDPDRFWSNWANGSKRFGQFLVRTQCYRSSAQRSRFYVMAL